MHHPYKHIIVTSGDKPVLIDFERARHSDEPSNVTQCCQFVTGSKLQDVLREKGIHLHKKKLIALAKDYKKSYSDESYTGLRLFLRKAFEE
jgi:predicted Ser/Thr protein kinase